MSSWDEAAAIYDTIFHIFYAITGTLGISFNAFLLYCAIYRSPHCLKEYRILIVKSAITDLIFIFSVAFVEPRMIATGSMYAYIVNGPAYYFGHDVAFIFYGFVLNMFFYMMLSFPLSFAYRYYVIVKPRDRRVKLLVASLGLYAVAFLQLIAFFFTQTDVVYVRQFLKKHQPEMNITGKVIYGSDMVRNPLTCVMVITSVITSPPVYIMVLYYRSKVNKVLAKKAASLSAATISTHRKLMEAITIHAALPVFFVFPPICVYLLQHVGVLKMLISEYLVFAMSSCIPVADALVTIYCIKPYCAVIREMLHMRTSQVNIDVFTTVGQCIKNRTAEAGHSSTRIFSVRTEIH